MINNGYPSNPQLDKISIWLQFSGSHTWLIWRQQARSLRPSLAFKHCGDISASKGFIRMVFKEMWEIRAGVRWKFSIGWKHSVCSKSFVYGKCIWTGLCFVLLKIYTLCVLGEIPPAPCITELDSHLLSGHPYKYPEHPVSFRDVTWKTLQIWIEVPKLVVGVRHCAKLYHHHRLNQSPDEWWWCF